MFITKGCSLSKGGFILHYFGITKRHLTSHIYRKCSIWCLYFNRHYIASYELGIITFSSFIGTVIGKIGRANENSVSTGLYGYNSVLTGIALMLFLTGPI